jgi:hypothetical protein
MNPIQCPITIKNTHFWKRYVKLIEHRIINPVDEDCEKHHIIPRSIGGSDQPQNIVNLKYREHYIAHYILAKSLDCDKLWFAFTMMQRISNGKSVLYEAARKYVSAAVSKSNTGRIRSQAAKEIMSRDRKNKVVVKDVYGNMHRVPIDDPKYLSGEYIFYRTGTKHKLSTIEKMQKNGLRGRRMFYRTATGEWGFLKAGEKLPVGCEMGCGPKYRKIMVSRKWGAWYNNPMTGESRRIKDNETVPPDFVKGRKIEWIQK